MKQLLSSDVWKQVTEYVFSGLDSISILFPLKLLYLYRTLVGCACNNRDNNKQPTNKIILLNLRYFIFSPFNNCKL